MKNIICIDDDQTILDIVKATLEITGAFEVFPFRLANEAVDRLDDIKPNLILLDMVMSVMNGTATVKILKAFDHTKNYPVAFLTAKSQPPDVESYMTLGACGVITKPIDIHTFIDEVQKLCTPPSAINSIAADNPKFAAMLSALQEKYLGQLAERRPALAKFLATCKQGAATDTSCDAVYGQVHSLAGSGATYGFADISAAARKLGEALQGGQRNPDILAELMRKLIAACDQARNQRIAAV